MTSGFTVITTGPATDGSRDCAADTDWLGAQTGDFSWRWKIDMLHSDALVLRNSGATRFSLPKSERS